MTKLKFEAELANHKSTIKIELTLISYIDGNIYYVYCPTLDLTGYDYNEEAAKKSFEQTLKLYLQYAINKHTLLADLQAHGWNTKNKKKIHPPLFNDMLKNNDDFKNIVEKHDFKKFRKEVQIPDYVYA